MTRLARVVAVASMMTTATTVLSAVGPATAASCAAGGGVSVVVDFNGIGSGGVLTSCVADGGDDIAADLFETAGHELTRAQRQPGFVCRVDAVPAEDPCVNTSPASAYWGLWWSDGESGEWTYSSLGVDSLRVPEGGSVAFSWDDVDGTNPPSATPPAAAPRASPSPGSGSGGSGGSGSGASGGGTSGPTGGAAPSGSASPTGSGSSTAAAGEAKSPRERLREADAKEERKKRIRATAIPVPTDSASASLDAPPEAETTSEPAAVSSEDGLPVWAAPVALLVLAAGAGVTVLRRRRSTP